MPDYPDNMEKLVGDCGYCWPKDGEADCEQRRQAILIAIVKLTVHWRQQVSEAVCGTTREKLYEHLNRRLWATVKKLKNVRKAAMIWKSGQNFDALVKAVSLSQITESKP